MNESTEDLRREERALRLQIAELRERRAEIDAELCRRATREIARRQREEKKSVVNNPPHWSERTERDL
ncbi:MAG: hypothetical protein IT579_25180 [Verrucomicrobia subdivision 3 bacterium]|nr:hypothetical protein [Limisphaerales bacterium]